MKMSHGPVQINCWIGLCTTDFFTAPASTRFHGACECGLVMHSLNVYHVLMKRYFDEAEDSKETLRLFPFCTTCARPITTNRGFAT